MSILKTKQCERFFNLSPTIFIYDLDGTIIDSSHRATHDAQGNIDLPAWRQQNTKEHILKDSLMPLYWKLRADYKNGNMIILCTAREIREWDKEFIHSQNIYFEKRWVGRRQRIKHNIAINQYPSSKPATGLGVTFGSSSTGAIIATTGSNLASANS